MIASLILLFALLGAGAGAVHFASLSGDVDLLAHGGSPIAALGLRLGRQLLTVGVLVVAARQGWPMLLAATAGFMVARHIALRWLEAAA